MNYSKRRWISLAAMVGIVLVFYVAMQDLFEVGTRPDSFSVLASGNDSEVESFVLNQLVRTGSANLAGDDSINGISKSLFEDNTGVDFSW